MPFKILPLASDSLGVRSLATYIETDQKILIDPGAALGPKRYGLPPLQEELKCLDKSISLIKSYAKKSSILTISHYHYDHYIPDENIYKSKILLIKDPKNNVNKSQEKRGKEFLDFIDSTPKKVDIADNKEFVFGKTVLRFSPPVYHGPDKSRLGFVLMLSVEYKNFKFIHASDIQGSQTKKSTEWIIEQNPDILMLSGFPTIFLGWKISIKNLDESNKNLIKILKKTKVKTIIMDHHLVRDLNYKKKISPVLKSAEELGKRVITVAEFLGRKNEFLEARRKELWKEKH